MDDDELLALAKPAFLIDPGYLIEVIRDARYGYGHDRCACERLIKYPKTGECHACFQRRWRLTKRK